MTVGREKAVENEGFYDKWYMPLTKEEKLELWMIGSQPAIERGNEDELPF